MIRGQGMAAFQAAALCIALSSVAAQTPGPAALHVAVLDSAQGYSLVRQLAAQAREAAAAHAVPVVLLEAGDCALCDALNARMSHPVMVDALRGAWIVRVNLGTWESQLDSIGTTSDRAFAAGIPMLYGLRTDGTLMPESVNGSTWAATVDAMAPRLKAFVATLKNGSR